MKKTKKIYFVRHTQTFLNKENRWNGCVDAELTEDGIKKMGCISEKMKNIKIDILYFSPLKRAMLLSEEIRNKSYFDFEIVVDDRIIERCFGSLQGKECNEKDKELFASWSQNSDYDGTVERIQDMYLKKVKPFIEDILNTKYENVLIVSHSWVGRLMKFYFSNEKDFDAIRVAPKCGETLFFNVDV